MAVFICGQRYRGSWIGITCMSIVLASWLYISYCIIFIVIQHFLEGVNQEYSFYGYTALSLLTILSIMQVIMSEPGKVYAVTRNSAGCLGWDYCEKCQKNRPPRSHHCSRCAKCVRKMDHHCIWINNCVGEDNNGMFIRFLSYSWLQSLISGVFCCFYYMDWFSSCQTCNIDSQDGTLRFRMLCLLLDVSWFLVFLSGMIVNKLLLLAADVSTIESMNSKGLLRARMLDVKNPGLMTHLKKAFGTSNMLLWFIPWCCESRITPEHEYTSQSIWTYDV